MTFMKGTHERYCKQIERMYRLCRNEEREIIFNLLAPATTEHHVTMGGTYLLNPTMEINVSYIHACENEQAGPTYISDDGSNYGRLQMSQDAIGGSFSMQY